MCGAIRWALAQCAWPSVFRGIGILASGHLVAARKEQPLEDSFFIWCHHRDEREARKFIRDALKTTPRPM